MKKLLAICSLFLIFSGCGEDNEGKALIGIWESDIVTITECLDGSNNRQINRRCDESSCYRLELNGDGSFSYQKGTLVETGTYSGDFRRLSLCIEDEGETVCENYTVGENTSVTLVLTKTDEFTECVTAEYFERVSTE